MSPHDGARVIIMQTYQLCKFNYFDSCLIFTLDLSVLAHQFIIGKQFSHRHGEEKTYKVTTTVKYYRVIIKKLARMILMVEETLLNNEVFHASSQQGHHQLPPEKSNLIRDD